MRIFSAFIILMLLGLQACSSSNENHFDVLQGPVDIRASSRDITYDRRTTRLVYVANHFGGTVTVLDQDKENFIDTDRGDDLDSSPIVVGGEPVALQVQDLDTPRIFVADEQSRLLWAYDADPSAASQENELPHIPVDLGSDTVAVANRPNFKNSGRSSSPVLQEIALDPALMQNEQWSVKFNSKDEYKVTGSKSGEQTGRAVENERYTTDNGALSFMILNSGNPTTENDEFLFGTILGKPLPLSGRPVDLAIDANQLYIVTSDPAQVIIFDLNSLTITSTVALVDGSGIDPALGRVALTGTSLFIPNSASPNAFLFNTSDQSVTVLATGVESIAAGVDGTTQNLYLFPTEIRQMNIWDLDAAALKSPLDLSDYGLGLIPFLVNGTPEALIPTAAGVLDVLDVNAGTRVDSDVTSNDPQSESFGKEFFDSGEKSEPDLIAIDTQEGVTKTERWQLTYEGLQKDGSRADGKYVVFGSISGLQEAVVTEGVSYTSDDGSISLTIRPSLSKPTTRGDFFTFLTSSGIDPISTNQKRGARQAAVFVRPNESVQTAYVAMEGSNSISVLNLETLRERKTIR